ncbi:MAG: hypothetical protein A2Z75_03410 [Chloroflexi bacterium RBG_13_50_10]|nr:MAG: hypothetical protein A2Z75_03410 [Chloroflexi bacterium RBG_13_50_10]
MNKHKWLLVLIAISMVILSGLAACAPSATGPAGKPTIKSFTASPTSLTAGEQTTISWDVSGVTEVTIQPEIGRVGPSGSLSLTPAANTTYTLTANNKAGSDTSSVTVTVTPAAVSKSDLTITDTWFAGDLIYFKIKNQGAAASTPSMARLYVDGFTRDSKYEDILAPGEEKTDAFTGYQYTQQRGETTAAQGGYEFPPTNIKVCADEANAVDESNEGNNCFSQMWGLISTYDFQYYAPQARWRTSHGDLRWNGRPDDENGAAYIYLGNLITCPAQIPNSWMLGRYWDFATTKDINITNPIPQIKVPPHSKFIADVGFKTGSNSTDGARVAFGYLDDTFSLVLFPKMDVYNDGKLHRYEADLSALANKDTEFFLWIETKASPEGDCVKWVKPRMFQE